MDSGLLNPKMLEVDANALIYQVPGGMLSNLVSQLKQAGKEDKLEEVLQGGAARAQGRRLSAAGYPVVADRGHSGGVQRHLGRAIRWSLREFKGLVRGRIRRDPR